MSTYRILLADRDKLFRTALAAALVDLTAQPDSPTFSIVATTGRGEELVDLFEKQNVDLILTDINLYGINGYDAAKMILFKNPKQKIMVLSAHASPTNVRKSLQLGLQGHISKDCSIEEFRSALNSALAGNKHFDPKSLLAILSENSGTTNEGFLNNHELELLKELCKGKSNAQIARSMDLNARTVERRLRTLIAKTKVNSRTGLAIYAVRNGLC